MVSWKAARLVTAVRSRVRDGSSGLALAAWPAGVALAALGASALLPTDARAESAAIGSALVLHPARSFLGTAAAQRKPLTSATESLSQRYGFPLPVRSDVRQHYDVESVLGCGGFGLVHLGRDKKSDAPVAIKRVCKTTTSKDKFLQEVEILRAMGGQHNIIGLCEAFETSDAYVLVTELAAGEELFDHLVNHGVFAEARAKLLVREIAQALQYLHGHHVVHGDIKPENILLSSDSSMKLIDFGQSFREHDSCERSRCVGSGIATVAYAAPETLRKDTAAAGSALDMWALGVVLYVLLCGFHPFDPENAATDQQLSERILSGSFETDAAEWCELPAAARDLIEQLLQVNATRRITADAVLRHNWIVGAADIVTRTSTTIDSL